MDSMPDKEVRKLAAVMFTDIEGYSAMVQQDEKGAMEKVSSHRHFLELFTSRHNGRIIQFYGDGSLSIYESAVDAVNCAIEMQKAYRSGVPVPVRIGIHVGDIILKNETVFGDGVNVASRIQATGIPGSVFISHRVQTELANHPDIHTKSLGHAKLKNISSPIEIFAVTNDGLAIPKVGKKIPGLKKAVRYLPFILLAGIAIWFIQYQVQGKGFRTDISQESISIPVFTNYTGNKELDLVGQMASHWITKELSATYAHIVSYESASEMIKLASMDISTSRGKKKYASLTGAVNIVEAAYYQTGTALDSLMMRGWFKNLLTGEIINSLQLPDVRCSSADPLECIKLMANNIKGHWVSKDDRMLTPPNYEAYKAYLAARGAWRTQQKEFVVEQLNRAIALDPTFIDPYFLMLDFLFNEGDHAAAYDTIQSIRRKFSNLDTRQLNMLNYHSADVAGKNIEAYNYFMTEYAYDPKDLFTNNSAMVLALMYRHKPVEALKFFNAIPFDSLHVEGCSYCGERLELAMWAALESGNMKLADQLAPKIDSALFTRQSYGMLIMHSVWKKDTAQIDLLLQAARDHPQLDRSWLYLNYLAGRLFLLRGDRMLASRYARKAIAEYELAAVPNARMLGRSHYLNGELDTSLNYYKTAHAEDSVEAQRIAGEIGMIYARKGDAEEAGKVIQSLDSLRVSFDYGATEYYQGRIYALLGDLEKATSLMELSLRKGQKFQVWSTFTHDPDLEVLRDYPRYKELLSSLK